MGSNKEVPLCRPGLPLGKKSQLELEAAREKNVELHFHFYSVAIPDTISAGQNSYISYLSSHFIISMAIFIASNRFDTVEIIIS